MTRGNDGEKLGGKNNGVCSIIMLVKVLKYLRAMLNVAG